MLMNEGVFIDEAHGLLPKVSKRMSNRIRRGHLPATHSTSVKNNQACKNCQAGCMSQARQCVVRGAHSMVALHVQKQFASDMSAVFPYNDPAACCSFHGCLACKRTQSVSKMSIVFLQQRSSCSCSGFKSEFGTLVRAQRHYLA